jgi:L-ascorbate metabolism protein UlaG (beta-lactamase superfamily)
MKIKWYGHSAFRLTSEDGTTVILDPYETGCYNGGIAYQPIKDEADIVIASHDHPDHSWVQGIPGNPIIVRTPCAQVIKRVKIEGIPTFHDKSRGAERGRNIVFSVQIDGVRICHLGDLGHQLRQKDADYLKPVDVLLPPIGGLFTIKADEVDEIIKQLNPKVVIPMHYKTEKCGFPLATVDTFTSGKNNVKSLKVSEVEITKDSLPAEREIWLLDYIH